MLRHLLATALISLSGLAASPAVAQEKEVKFMLDFIALGRHAPWYVAREKGFFADEGLDVEIIPSKGTADAIRGVVTDIASIGLIDVPSLAASGAAADAIKIVSGAYVEAPYCVYSLDPGSNVSEPSKLEGVTFGSSSASFLPNIWKAFMNMNGLDPSTLKVVNIDGSARVSMLAAGQVESIDLFLMSGPAIKRAAPDKKPVCLFAADYGLDLYSNSIGVNADYLEKNPDVVKGFVKAAMRGWQYTMAHREEAADIMVEALPALDKQIVREEIDLIERIAINEDVKANGFGHIDPEKFAKTFEFIYDNVEVSTGKLDPSTVLVEGYMPQEPYLP